MKVIASIFGTILVIFTLDIINIRISINQELRLYEKTKDMNWRETIKYINNNVHYKKVNTTIQKIKFLRGM